MPSARDQPEHILQLEEQVWWHEHVRDTSEAGIGEGEPAVAEAGGGAGFGD